MPYQNNRLETVFWGLKQKTEAALAEKNATLLANLAKHWQLLVDVYIVFSTVHFPDLSKQKMHSKERAYITDTFGGQQDHLQTALETLVDYLGNDDQEVYQLIESAFVKTLITSPEQLSDDEIVAFILSWQSAQIESYFRQTFMHDFVQHGMAEAHAPETSPEKKQRLLKQALAFLRTYNYYQSPIEAAVVTDKITQQSLEGILDLLTTNTEGLTIIPTDTFDQDLLRLPELYVHVVRSFIINLRDNTSRVYEAKNTANASRIVLVQFREVGNYYVLTWQDEAGGFTNVSDGSWSDRLLGYYQPFDLDRIKRQSGIKGLRDLAHRYNGDLEVGNAVSLKPIKPGAVFILSLPKV